MRFSTRLCTQVSALLVITFVAPLAFASGYTCLSVDGDTRIDVVTDAADETLPASALSFIDPSASQAKQLIASFTLETGLLKSEAFDVGHRFTATVDTSVPGSDHAGRHLGGTTLGALSQIVVEIQTVSVAHPVQIMSEGTLYAGQVSYLKKKGQTLVQDFDCTLFLGDSPHAF